MERINNFIKKEGISFLVIVLCVFIAGAFSSCATGTAAKNGDPKPIKVTNWLDSLQGNRYQITSVGYQLNPGDTTVYATVSSNKTVDTTKMQGSSTSLNYLFMSSLPGNDLFFGYQTMFFTLDAAGNIMWVWQYGIDDKNSLFSLYVDRQLVYSFKIDKKSTKSHLILYTPVGNSTTPVTVSFTVGSPVKVYGLYVVCDFTKHYDTN